MATDELWCLGWVDRAGTSTGMNGRGRHYTRRSGVSGCVRRSNTFTCFTVVNGKRRTARVAWQLCYRQRAEKAAGGELEVVSMQWSPTMDVIVLAFSYHSVRQLCCVGFVVSPSSSMYKYCLCSDCVCVFTLDCLHHFRFFSTGCHGNVSVL